MGVKRGYKQTEAGMIPEEWEVKPLHELAEKIMVGIASAATHAYRDRGVVMFRNQNIKPGHLDDSDIIYIAEDYEETFRNKRLKPGDLLTARTGYPGTTSIVPPQYAGAQSFTTLITRPRGNVINSAYLCHFINSETGQVYFEQTQIGGGQKNVNAGSLKHLPVALPPTKAEQEAIAEALSDADALIQSLGQLVAKKRQLKQGAMQELLTGRRRLPGFERKRGYKQSEVGVIPVHWEVLRIRDLVKQGPQNGYSGRGSDDARGTPTLSLAATSSGRLILSQATVKRLQRLIPAGSPLFLEPFDVLVQRSNTIDLVGTTAVFDGPGAAYVYPDLMMRLRFRTRVTGLWFWRYANSSRGRRFFRTVAAGSTGSMPKISGEKLREMPLPVPPPAEQSAIIDLLSDMDAEIAALEAKLAKARQIKQGMMQELLTGRIRLV